MRANLRACAHLWAYRPVVEPVPSTSSGQALSVAEGMQYEKKSGAYTKSISIGPELVQCH